MAAVTKARLLHMRNPIYVYNIAWLVGVYAIYTTLHRGQRKFTS